VAGTEASKITGRIRNLMVDKVALGQGLLRTLCFPRQLSLNQCSILIFIRILFALGTAVAHWLRRCATNRKVAGSIPAGGYYGPGVDSASNRQEYFLGVKAAAA